MEQIFIALFGVTAIFLSQHKSIQYQKFACIAGILAQPFWFYTTYQAEQWGLFGMSFLYAGSWLIGLKNYWFKGDEDNGDPTRRNEKPAG